jgi:hypothetical protein
MVPTVPLTSTEVVQISIYKEVANQLMGSLVPV